jgi:hypothetical protein
MSRRSWPWPEGARRQFVLFGVRPVPVEDPEHRSKIRLEAALTGSVCGVHVAKHLYLPRQTSLDLSLEFAASVLHELAHAAIWCRDGRAGDYQWGLNPADPESREIETEVACVHLHLVHRFRLAEMFNVQGLYRQFVDSLSEMPITFEIARANGRDAFRDALAVARS